MVSAVSSASRSKIGDRPDEWGNEMESRMERVERTLRKDLLRSRRKP